MKPLFNGQHLYLKCRSQYYGKGCQGRK